MVTQPVPGQFSPVCSAELILATRPLLHEGGPASYNKGASRPDTSSTTREQTGPSCGGTSVEQTQQPQPRDPLWRIAPVTR